MLEQIAAGEISLLTVWLLGVSMGLTACTVTCLPFMGTWALGRASGQREAFLHTGIFLGGRVFTYTVLATVAGAAGLGLAKALGGIWGNVLIGSVSILSGLWLVFGSPARGCGGASATPGVAPIRFQRKADTLPPLFFGAALSLTPCTPLASLLLLAANTGSATRGAAYGLAFGLGAALTPIIVLVPLAGRLGREIRSGRAWLGRWLAGGAGLVLIVLGLRRLTPFLF